ncbi:MAG: decaprenyl-phosphate phosphoribosyltransferase [Bacteroidaceae bacterium]|nr:decaprenyl-phosphate phosphoribosyltransferase [Bacteroidaceae bacterium]MBR3758728.1 decaprenyl-phosphate phosphoribosyltransferase [Bacteroidaceae bacterium]
MKLQEYIRLIRPHQWLKNLFVFLPLFFSGNMTNWSMLLATIYAAMSFAFISSSIYCLNDIIDVETDKQHPEKRNRPIAKGSVSLQEAYTLMILMCLLAYGVLFLLGLNGKSILVISIYFVLNILYCVNLKQIPLVDIFIVSSGFVLRIILGGLVCNIELSQWIILMTFLLSLFLAISKRLDDIRIYNEKKILIRKNISHYNVEYIQLTLSIIASVTIVCYIMYTVDVDVVSRIDNHYLYLSSLLVILGVLRFLQIAIVEKQCCSPTKILMKDKFIQICIVTWGVFFLVLLYW